MEAQDPTHTFIDAIAERVVSIMRRDGLQPSTPAAMLSIPAGREPIHPDRFYTAKDLARRWNFVSERTGEPRTASVYEIQEIELPRRRVGSGRGRTLFYGLDVMVYEGTISREVADAFQESRVAVLVRPAQEPPRIRRLRNALDAREEP